MRHFFPDRAKAGDELPCFSLPCHMDLHSLRTAKAQHTPWWNFLKSSDPEPVTTSACIVPPVQVLVVERWWFSKGCALTAYGQGLALWHPKLGVFVTLNFGHLLPSCFPKTCVKSPGLGKVLRKCSIPLLSSTSHTLPPAFYNWLHIFIVGMWMSEKWKQTGWFLATPLS